MSNFLAPRVEQILFLELELELYINISLIGAVHGARSAPGIFRVLFLQNTKEIQIKYGARSAPEIFRVLSLSNAKAIQIKYGAPSTPGQLSGVEVMFPAPALASMLRI